jgi:hypothetical protein
MVFTTDSEPFPFFSLPLELRNVIYKHNSHDLQPIWVQEDGYLEPSIALRSSIEPSLLRVSKRFKLEYEAIYSAATYIINVYGYPRTKFPTILPSSALRFIFKLKLNIGLDRVVEQGNCASSAYDHHTNTKL